MTTAKQPATTCCASASTTTSRRNQFGAWGDEGLHGKRGFATVERGCFRRDAGAGEALENADKLRPGWCRAAAQLLDPESLDSGAARPLTHAELEALSKHPDKWVKETAQAASQGPGQHMKELIALKRVPLFSTLTLEQLASIDRLMVTRHYVKGEPISGKVTSAPSCTSCSKARPRSPRP